MPESQEPKIIIDTDWKTQAQAEKEKLAQAEAAKKAQKEAVGGGGGGPDAGEPVRFEDLIGLLATQALSYLGYMQDPATGRAVVSLDYAKMHIDMLAVLEQKTKGNLSEQEAAALSKTVAQMRMEFVEVSKVIAKAIQEGKIKPASMAGTGGKASPEPVDLSGST